MSLSNHFPTYSTRPGLVRECIVREQINKERFTGETCECPASDGTGRVDSLATVTSDCTVSTELPASDHAARYNLTTYELTVM